MYWCNLFRMNFRVFRMTIAYTDATVMRYYCMDCAKEFFRLFIRGQSLMFQGSPTKSHIRDFFAATSFQTVSVIDQ